MAIRARRYGIGALLVGLVLSGCATTRHTTDTRASLMDADLAAAWLSDDGVHLILGEEGRAIHAEAGTNRDEDISADNRTGGPPFGRTRFLRAVRSERMASAEDWRPLRSVPRAELEELLRMALDPFAPGGASEAVRLTLGRRELYMVRRAGPESELLFLDALPVGYRVVSTYAGPALREDLLNAYGAWSAAHERPGDPALFVLGPVTADPVPYLVLDPEAEDGYTLAFRREGAWDLERDATSRAELAWVLVKSHTLSVVTHPVTSTRRLAALVRDAVTGLLSRSHLSLGKFPELDQMPIPEIDPDREPMDLVEFEAFLDRYAAEPPARGRLEFLIGGDAYFRALHDHIDAAREQVDIQTYIFDNDPVAVETADRLRNHPHGVAVRVLCDGLGTVMAARVEPAASLGDPAERPASITGYLRQAPNVRVRVRPNTWGAGDHSKVIIVDRKAAFLGGMNIGQEYRYEWHDLMVEATGPLAAALQDYFDRTWDASGLLGELSALGNGPARAAEPADTEGLARVHILRTTPWRQAIYRAQVEAARRARHHIYVENAYLADDLIVYELCSARKRGVDVRVVMPAKGNHEIMNRNNVLVANALLKHGVRVYLYPGMTHVKAAVFDGWACFGSANLDRLSLQTNLEMNLATAHPETVARLTRELFEKDMAASIELHEPLKAESFDWIYETLGDSL